MTLEAKREIVTAVSGKSARETERALLSRAAAHAPSLALVPALGVRPDREQALTAEHTEIRLVAGRDLMARIERVREIKGSHLGLEEIFIRALDAYLERETRERPLRERPTNAKPSQSVSTSEVPRVTRPPQRSRYIPIGVRREVMRRSGGRCEFVDDRTRRRCESQSALQWDHVVPYARGGTATVGNIRQVCPAHQQWAAIQTMGRGKMREYLQI